ncbi:DUF2970 domain-containing protein [Congregibacter sp.]|uniref:DUF2970 domain-containing protein n=1 Tax=Congregibacter sp. TaxID=2744308 RepID=UPI003F6AE0A5
MTITSDTGEETTPERPKEEGHEHVLAGAPGNPDENAPGDEEHPTGASLNSLQVLSSVLAAGLGVQSSKNRERDFKQGRAGTFIVAGLLFTALFIGTVYTIVTVVLSSR